MKLTRHLNPLFLHQGIQMSEAEHISQGENESMSQGGRIDQGEIVDPGMEKGRELTGSVSRGAGLISGRRLSTLTSLASLERFDQSTSFEVQSLFPFAILHLPMKPS